MRFRLFSLGLILLFLMGCGTRCLGGVGCDAPEVDFGAASEAVQNWAEGCIGGYPDTADDYWSPVSEQVGQSDCRALPLLRRSLQESAQVPGIDYYRYYSARVVSVEAYDSSACSTALSVFLERSDGRLGGPLVYLVANGDTSPNRIILYETDPQCTWPQPASVSQTESFESCFWRSASQVAEPQPADVHIFRIDTHSPNLSFEMVMAEDSRNVNEGKEDKSSPRQRVADMVARPPYASRNPVLAFNADYFAKDNDHGPEGLTIKNGERFDGQFADPPDYDALRLAEDGNTNETNRSSLSLSTLNAVRIGRQTDCDTGCVSWPFTGTAYYNTTGGGPLFIEDGKRVGGFGSQQPCEHEGFSTASDGYCGNAGKPWTAVGVSQDGRYLIVAVGESETMDTMASVLLAEGAWRAMKLDGGGSTQLWYRGEEIISGSRAVANAILVFSQP